MKTEVLRIRDWKGLFENNRTRELKKLDWVPMPNKHDGDGYSELLDHPSGTAHYGAWCLIAQVASKCEEVAPGCGGRGTLLRDGARPYDAASLARVTRGQVEVFEEAIPRLISIGWLERISLEIPILAQNPADECGNPAGGCGKVPIEGKGREGKGREGAHEADAIPEPVIPTVEEVLAYTRCGRGIPDEYVRDYVDKCGIKKRWIVTTHKGLEVIDWRKEIVKWWAKDQASFMANGGKPKTPPRNAI